MKKEVYSECELCRKTIYDPKECVEVSIDTKLYFIDSMVETSKQQRVISKDFVLGGGFASLCPECFFKKDSIKKAILSRWTRSTDLYELAQLNYDRNIHTWKGMKTKNKNKVLLSLLQEI